MLSCKNKHVTYNTNTVTAMLLVLILYAAFGLSFTIGKFLIMYSQPFFAVGARMTLGGLLLLGYMRLYKGERFIIHRENISYYLQAILFNVFIPYTLRLWALYYVSTVKASLLFNLSPFFASFFSYMLLNERLSWVKAVSLVIGFCGGMIPLINQSPGEADLTSFGFVSYAELAILGSVASIAYGLIVSQRLVKDRGSPSYFITGISMFFGGLLAFIFSGLFETNVIWDVQEPLIKGNGLHLLYILAFQILLSNVICQNLRVELLKRYSSTFMAFASLLGPLFTSIYGILIFNEQVTLGFIVSFVIVLIGLALYHYDDNISQTIHSNFTQRNE